MAAIAGGCGTLTALRVGPNSIGPRGAAAIATLGATLTAGIFLKPKLPPQSEGGRAKTPVEQGG